jgi:regulation of enolase protein 1 (concanavalin A-like superfamily)
MRIPPFILGLVLCCGLLAVTPAEDSFTIAVIPDTQQEVLGANDTRFANRIQYLLANRTALNLKVMCQVGDLVNWDTTDHIQYQRASAGLKLLDDARLPYVLSIGNHDTAATGEGGGARPGGNASIDVRNTTTFNQFFPVSRHQIVRGTHLANKIDTAYHTFTAGDRNWLVINVELWPRADHVTWTRTILNNHPNHNAIIVTHSYLNGGTPGTPSGNFNSIYGGNGGYGANSPQYLWDQALKHCANVRMVFCGHVGTHGYRVDTGVNGNKVHSFLQNYASNFDNYVRLLTINTRTGTIQSRIHNPIKRVDANDGSTYTVTGVSWVGTGTVTPVAPTITTQPTSRTVTVGQTASFGIAATGTPAPAYQWQRNGANIGGATSATYTTPATTTNDNGATFRCVVSNSAGSRTSSSATLTVTGGAVIGNGTGLSGAYFGNQDLTGTAVLRQDATVDFTWAEAAAPVSGIGAGTYSIRWAGQVQAQYSQAYTFHVLADDGVRLWVDGRLLVDQWRDQSPTEYSGTITLNAGARYDIALEYYQIMGGARIALQWSSPSTSKRLIPTSQLHPAGVPAPWAAQDLGSGTLAGSGYVTGDTVVLTGAGGDIYQSADGGRMLTQPMTGDGTIVARVVSMTNTNPWAKAGIMIREGTGAGARHAFCFVTPNTTNGVGFIRRTATSALSTYTGGSKSTAPRWLRLVRSGSTITASESANGTTWTVVGSVAVSLANPVRIGFAVTSGDNSRLCTAVFDVVSVTPAGSG